MSKNNVVLNFCSIQIFDLFITLEVSNNEFITMRKKVFILLGIAFFLVVGGYVFIGEIVNGSIFPDGENSKSRQIKFPKDKKILNPFVLEDEDGDFSFVSEDNFNFELSDDEILRPVSKDIITGIAEMQLYFGANEARRVEVIGYFSSSEKNTSSHTNLGIARANAIKEYLIIQGIPSSRIDLKGVQNDGLKHYKKVLYGPVEFKISLGTTNSEENE